MEKIVQGKCPTHGTLFQSFKCYTCNKFLCPDCLEAHPHKDKLVRAEIIGHFLIYDNERSCLSSRNVYIWTYNVTSKALSIQSFGGARYEQNSILIQYVVYLLGGITSMSNGTIKDAFNDVFAFDIRTGAAPTKKTPMITPVCFNALCTTTEREIFSVGGKNVGGYLNVCEKYDIANNRWKSLKLISIPRGNVSLCVYNCRIIYCIGGHCATFTDTFESLDTSNEENSWVIIQLALKAKFDPRNGMMIIQNPLKDNIMIFGGCSLLGIVKDVFEFRIAEKAVIKQPMTLVKAAVFIERQPVLWNDVYYFFEYGRSAGYYTYSLQTNKLERTDAETYLGKANYNKII